MPSSIFTRISARSATTHVAVSPSSVEHAGSLVAMPPASKSTRRYDVGVGWVMTKRLFRPTGAVRWSKPSTTETQEEVGGANAGAAGTAITATATATATVDAPAARANAPNHLRMITPR